MVSLAFKLKNILSLFLGGGVNVVGTSERYGSAADHVERYTMVDAMGRILLVIFCSHLSENLFE
jgi:hypothetical protein